MAGNAFRLTFNVVSLDTCRPKCISGVLKCALARRLTIQMPFWHSQMRSRSTPVEPNRKEKTTWLKRCSRTLARRLSIQNDVDRMTQMVCFYSRPTPVDPNRCLIAKRMSFTLARRVNHSEGVAKSCNNCAAMYKSAECNTNL